MKMLINYGYFFSFALFPIYAFPSGGVQISHILLLLTFFMSLFLMKFKFQNVDIILLFYFLYVLLREILAFSASQNIESLIPAVYVFYSLIVFYIVTSWFSKNIYSGKILKYGIFIAVIVAIFGIFVFGFRLNIESAGGRAVGTFNNPNQLGYFSICVLSISAILFFKDVINRVDFFILASGCLFMAITSLSKAAMVSIAIPLCVLPWTFIQKSHNKKLISIATVSILIFLFTIVIKNYQSLESYAFYHRLAGIGSDSDDSLAGRGYNILFDVGAIELFFGYGVERARHLIGHEVHSTLGSVIINYGLVGFSLFASFMMLWAKKIFKCFGFSGLFMVVLPPMAYGLTHNGTRFTIFWVLLALSFSNNHYDYKYFPTVSKNRLKKS